MEANQTKIIDLLREAHLIAFKEIERLNLRIAELETQHRQPVDKRIPTPAVKEPTAVNLADLKPTAHSVPPKMLNEHQVEMWLDSCDRSL